MIPGLHHVTAIASDPQRNYDFYAGVLGLRLVKKTVNFDDPGTYHFYFGDSVGHPGTILTFFPWPQARRGRHGNGQTTVTSFAVPRGSLGVWTDRLQQNLVSVSKPAERFGAEYISFADPDGLMLELVEMADGDGHAIQKFHSVTLAEEGFERTAVMLTTLLGFEKVAENQGRFRFAAKDAGPGAFVDVMCMPDSARGSMGAGVVHHIAWRTANSESQLEWRQKLADAGFNVTPVMDRQYFTSIYFREPGGVLFEIATDGPGFLTDETPEELGTHLKLPPWFEPVRETIEASLPPLDTSRGVADV